MVIRFSGFEYDVPHYFYRNAWERNNVLTNSFYLFIWSNRSEMNKIFTPSSSSLETLKQEAIQGQKKRQQPSERGLVAELYFNR